MQKLPLLVLDLGDDLDVLASVGIQMLPAETNTRTHTHTRRHTAAQHQRAFPPLSRMRMDTLLDVLIERFQDTEV